MAQPSSTAPDEEMRSPSPKPRRFAWFFQPIAPLLLCALCSVSLGVFAYMQSSLISTLALYARVFLSASASAWSPRSICA